MILSIIIPAYNASGTILRCLLSLVDDSCIGDYEIIIINDGSTDNSGEVIKEWTRHQKISIKYIETPNEGVSAARNRGINEAVGDWIFFCDADDYVSNGSIHTLIHFLDGADETLKLVKIGMRHVPDHFVSDADSCIWGGDLRIINNRDFFLNEIFWAVWVLIFKRSHILENHLKFTRIYVSEDTIFNTEYLLSGQYNVGILNADIYRYVANPFSVTSNLSSNKVNRKIIESHIEAFKTYDKIAESYEADQPIYQRINWLATRDIPVIFIRIINTKLSISELMTIKHDLMKSRAIPISSNSEMILRFEGFLLNHPSLLRLFSVIYRIYKRQIRCTV